MCYCMVLVMHMCSIHVIYCMCDDILLICQPWSLWQITQNCLYRGKTCNLKPDPRHPDWWIKVVRFATTDQRGVFDLRKVVLDVCDHRSRNIPAATRMSSQSAGEDQDVAFHKVQSMKTLSHLQLSTAHYFINNWLWPSVQRSCSRCSQQTDRCMWSHGMFCRMLHAWSTCWSPLSQSSWQASIKCGINLVCSSVCGRIYTLRAHSCITATVQEESLALLSNHLP